MENDYVNSFFFLFTGINKNKKIKASKEEEEIFP